MEMLLQNELDRIKTEVPVPIESKRPPSGSENLFVQARSSGIIAIAYLEDIKGALRYAMVKVGLRANNFPVEEEKAVLIDHIITNYGGHTTAEIRLAFNMAINGELELTIDDVNCYENFSCLYFSKIMNAYRKWSHYTNDLLMRSTNKQLPAPEPVVIDWREVIETAYQSYLTKGELNSSFFPGEFYDTVVADGYVAPTYYEHMMKHARTEIERVLQLEVHKAMQVDQDYKKAVGIQESILKLKAGENELMVELRAKQGVIITLFKKAAKKQMKNLYIYTKD